MGKIDSAHVPSRSDRSLALSVSSDPSVHGTSNFNHKAYTQRARPSKFGSTTFHLLRDAGKNKRRIRHSADLHEHVWFPLSFPDPGESNGGKETEKKMFDLTISILVLPPQFAQIWWVLVCQRDVVFVLVAYQFFPAVTCWPTCGKNHTCSKCCEQKKGDCSIQNCNR